MRFFTSVNSDVTNWVLLLSKRFLAKRTLIKLPHIYRCSSLKNIDCICICVKKFSFRIRSRLQRSLMGIQNMSFDTTFPIEFLITVLTPKGFFTSVTSQMIFNIIRTSSNAKANWAGILLYAYLNGSILQKRNGFCSIYLLSFLFHFKGIITSGCFLRICLFRLDICVKVSLHWGQAYGFSPVWTKIWCSIPYKSLKTVGQNGHLYWPAPSLIGLCNARIRKESQQNLPLLKSQLVVYN